MHVKVYLKGRYEQADNKKFLQESDVNIIYTIIHIGALSRTAVEHTYVNMAEISDSWDGVTLIICKNLNTVATTKFFLLLMIPLNLESN